MPESKNIRTQINADMHRLKNIVIKKNRSEFI